MKKRRMKKKKEQKSSECGNRERKLINHNCMFLQSMKTGEKSGGG